MLCLQKPEKSQIYKEVYNIWKAGNSVFCQDKYKHTPTKTYEFEYNSEKRNILSLEECSLNDFTDTLTKVEQYKFKKTPKFFQFSSVQSLIHVQLFVTPWITARQASLSITNSWSLLKLMSIELMTPSSHLVLCHPLLLLPPIPPSIRVFSNESTPCMRLPKYWSFSFSISPFNEHLGLISFRMDWLYLLAAQGTLKSVLQHQKQFF